MHTPSPKSSRQPRFIRNRQAGAALVIAMFTLLLVSAVALSLVMASGTESSLAGNYRSSTSAYYAGRAGVEEARGRLLPSNPNFFNNASANFITVAGPLPTLAPGQVRYIINPANGEVVDPVAAGNPYQDKEYAAEWNGAPGPWPATLPPVGGGTQYINSIYLNPLVNTAGIQGPMFKWVRITPATEQSLGIDVDGSGGALDNQKEVFYDATLTNATGANDSLTLTPSVAGTSTEVFEITADAVMPNGSQKLMQYVVAPFTLNLNLPSALTIPGPIGSFNPPNSTGYCMDGNDTSQVTTNGIAGTKCSFTPPPPPPGAACNTTAPAVPAVGVSTGLDNAGSQTNVNYVDTQIPRPTNYVGSTGTTPSVSTPGLPPNLSSPQQLEQELNLIQQAANVNLNCSTTPNQGCSFTDIDTAPGSLWNSCGTSCGTTPQITYVNGNLDITGKTTGSGILVVTGTLTYSGDSSWNGIILVIGDGLTEYTQNGGGSGQFNGGIFVANLAGNPPTSYGPSDFTINGGGGNGVYYNSCWIANSQKPPKLQVLSYREIPNP